MARILILDDNRSGSARLKMIMIRHGHDVHRTDDVKALMQSSLQREPDLILISHAFGDYSGWDVFNRLKETFPLSAVMVFALESIDPVCMDRFVRAVAAGIEESNERRYGNTSNSLLFHPSIFHETNAEGRAST